MCMLCKTYYLLVKLKSYCIKSNGPKCVNLVVTSIDMSNEKNKILEKEFS